MGHKNPNNLKRKDNPSSITSRNKSRRYGTLNDIFSSYGPGGGNDEFIDIILGKFYENNSDEHEESDLEEVFLDVKIKNIDDLIELGEKYNPKEKKKYNINLKALSKLKEPLVKLKKMIGMKNLKNAIKNQIIYFLQDFEKKNTHMMHTIIEGPPGSGKTEVANILAAIYAKLGFLKKEFVHKVKRSDLIGQYLGQTAIKTQKAIEEANGGVLLIDEAYSLGNPEGRDSYSKECIDTINQNLSEKKADFICIIVGYKKSLKDSFFNYNPGLERRFPFRYTIDEYDHNDLKLIFEKLVEENKWELTVDKKKLEDFFEENRKVFTFNGGDLETLLQCSKITHALRVFGQKNDEKKKINLEDIENALEEMMKNEEIKKRKVDDMDFISHLYC